MAVYTLEEYAKLKKKKDKQKNIILPDGYEEKVIENAITLEENLKRKGMSLDIGSSDIAPVRSTVSKKEEERTWFQKSEGNLLDTILGSVADVGENLTSGILGMGEKFVDAMAYLAPSIQATQMAQTGQIVPMDTYDKMKEDVKEFAEKDLYDEQDVAKKIITKPAKAIGIDAENNSVFGAKTDSLVQSAGQLGATVGLQAVGVPWWLTTGGTSFGGEVETAFKEGANYEQAGGSALISAGAEILTEKLSGGIKFGGKTLDDVVLKPLTEKIANKTVRTLTNFGLDAAGEGTEEVISTVISNLGTSLYKEENIEELLTSEEAIDEYIESFIGGAVLGGGVSAISTAAETKNAAPKFTVNEKAVIEKETENRIAERETEGKKLSNKEKLAIEEQVKKDLDKGYISIDTIESTLGGETYNQYKSITDKESNLTQEIEKLENMKAQDITVKESERLKQAREELEKLKNNSNKTQIKEQLSKEVQELTKIDRLSESYNEKARRSQAFEADLTKYDEKQQAVIKKAAESGILNNTNRTHEFVDMIAKISADKGVLFDFINNEKLKETGFAVEGKTVNGYIKDGNIAVNIDSNKALNTVVGHEITHVLEGTELYTELQSVVKEFATTKGEYQARYDALKELYKDVEGAVIENEITADLVGEYLFTDSDFINNLSTKKPNVFKKIYEEIKYLYKIATAGSKEARELEKVKRAFDKAYKESKTVGEETKYSFAGENAATSDKSQLQIALSMNSKGFSSEEIRTNTGWHKGYDGKWRYEIDDSQMEIIDTESNSMTLDQILQHDKLFEAYPMLKKIDVIFEDLGTNKNGSFDSRFFAINLNTELKNDPERLKNTLIHEVQHAIQYEEGFANGSNSEYWDMRLERGFDSRPRDIKVKEKDYRDLYSALEEDDPEFVAEMEKLEEMTPTVERGAIDWETFEQIEEDPIEWQEFDAERDRLTEKYGMDRVFDFMDMQHNIKELKTKGRRTGTELYYDTAGEIEARETTRRRTFSEEERKRYQPKNKYENVNRDKVVFARYSLSEDTGLYEYIQDALKDKLPAKSYYKISDSIPDRMAEDIENIVGFSVKGYGNEISPGNIKHINKEHGMNGRTDNSMKDFHNLAKLSYVIDNYDNIREGKKSTEYRNSDGSYAKTVELQKKIADGFYYVVEAVPDSTKKRLHIVSAYINKKDTFSDVLVSKDPKRYVQDEHRPNVSSKYIIPENTEKGNALSQKQKEYFKDSVVRDENGNLKVMYHGTSKGGHTVFDPYGASKYGLFGAGSYFTDNKSVAESYTEKGKGDNKQVYETYLNITNPIDMDAQANPEAWKKAMPDVDFPESGTNESFYRAMEEYFREQEYAKWEASEAAVEALESMGYDGITHIGGGRFNKADDTRHQVYIAFQPEQIKNVGNTNPTTDADIRHSMGEREVAPTGNYHVYGKDIALETPENAEKVNLTPPNGEKISESAPKNAVFEDYAPLTEEEANERDAMQGDRLYDVNDLYMPEEAEAPYYEETVEPTEAVSPFEEKDIQEVGNRKQKAYMYENPEVKPFFQEEARIMLGELERSVKGEKHFNDQLYYDSNGEQGWFGTKRETSEQIAYMLDRFKYTYADIEKGLKAIIEDHGAENNAISKRLEFMLDERLREGYTDFGSGYEIPSNQEYIKLLNEKQVTEYSDEAYNRYLESLAYEEAPQEDIEAPLDEVQVLYSLEEQQEEKLAELDSVVEAEDTTEPAALPTIESFNAKVENYKNALEGYKTAKDTIETAFDDAINKKTAEYEALKRKDTKKATDLLMQIENLKLRKNNNVTKIDSKIAKVEATIDKLSNGIPTKRQIYHRNIVENIKNTFSSKGFDFDKVLENAKNKGTFSSVDNTPQRFIEKSLGYKEGQILNDLTVNKVAQNESKGIQWINSYTDKNTGLLAKISKEYGIKPRSKESAAAQMYAEGFWVDDDGNFIKYGDEELAKDFRNEKVRENIKKLAKDERIRKIYDDTLKMINDSRTRNLYPEIPRRKNYFLHFREMEDTFSKLGIPFNPNDIRLKDLPTDINGMTADLKPGQPYFASAKQRMGYKTTYDLVGGVERYLNSAKNQIYHIDDIQTLRALRNYIADTFGQAKGLESLDSMTEEEAVARIEEVYNSHLSTFAKFLNEEANTIAGKTSLTDRGLEGVIGRRGIQFLDTVNRQVGSNMVGGNISSALTNTVSMVQAVAKSNKFDVTKAFAQTVSNQLGSIIGKTDGFVENNPMMIRRKGIERMTKTPWESITDKGYLLMGAIDNISSEFIARTKFNELTRKGMSEQQAHIEADKWASRILGDRSIGQQPQLYNSKMLGLITKFQLEVRNQLDSQFYDTIQEAKVSNEEIENKLIRNMKTSAKIGSTFFQLAVLQHLFGKGFESIAGYNPTFDIVEALIQVLGFDDDEESEDTVLDNLEEGFLTLLEDLPYTSTFTGGRIPISSALPVKQFITGKDSYGNEKSRWETIKETAPYYLAPTGYGQFKKTMQGLEMFSDEHPVAGSYTKSGNLRFPIEDTPENRVKSAIFGQYASENARDYFDNERSPLKEKQIQEYKDLDIPIRDYWEYREGLSKQDKLEDKFDYIAGLDLPVEKKNIMINNIVDRKEAVDMAGYDDFGSLEEFDFATKQPEKYALSKVVGGYSAYLTYQKELNDIKADKDANGKTISGSRKEKVLNYIENLDADYYEKIILFKSEYKADDTYNEEIVNYLNNRSDIAYEEEVEILKGLGFTVEADGTVRW